MYVCAPIPKPFPFAFSPFATPILLVFYISTRSLFFDFFLDFFLLRAADLSAAASAAADANEKRASLCGALLRPAQVLRWDFAGVFFSNVFGKVNSVTLPRCLRAPLYRLWYAYAAVVSVIAELLLPCCN